MKILITGGSGFIGSNFIRHIYENTNYNILNLDMLTYAANNKFSKEILNSNRYEFIKENICDKKISNILLNYSPNIVVHMAAESHVDNSIKSPESFLETNIFGTYNLLISCQKLLAKFNKRQRSAFKFINISTDEVYGDLNDRKYKQKAFTENTSYKPSSPYSASKASADHLVEAWNRTYNFPSIKINCSNNYGPHQHSEKLIPLIIKNAISGKKLPIYGNGKQKRDWIFVKDHVRGLLKIIEFAKAGTSYNIGARNVLSNLSLVKKICIILENLYPVKENPNIKNKKKSYYNLINFVADRLGHDVKYAVNPQKIETELQWKAETSLNKGLSETINWYLKKFKVKLDYV